MLEGDNNIRFRQDDPPEGGAQDPESVTQYYINRIQNAGSLVELNSSVTQIERAMTAQQITSFGQEYLYRLVDARTNKIAPNQAELQKNTDHYLGFILGTTDKTAIGTSLTNALNARNEGAISRSQYQEIKDVAERRLNQIK